MSSVCFSCARCKEIATADNILAFCPDSKRDKPHQWIACQWTGEMGDPNEPAWVFEANEELGRTK